MDLTAYQGVFNLITTSAAASLPIVVVCGLVGRAYNALVGMVTGERRVKL